MSTRPTILHLPPELHHQILQHSLAHPTPSTFLNLTSTNHHFRALRLARDEQYRTLLAFHPHLFTARFWTAAEPFFEPGRANAPEPFEMSRAIEEVCGENVTFIGRSRTRNIDGNEEEGGVTRIGGPEEEEDYAERVFRTHRDLRALDAFFISTARSPLPPSMSTSQRRRLLHALTVDSLLPPSDRINAGEADKSSSDSDLESSLPSYPSTLLLNFLTRLGITLISSAPSYPAVPPPPLTLTDLNASATTYVYRQRPMTLKREFLNLTEQHLSVFDSGRAEGSTDFFAWRYTNRLLEQAGVDMSEWKEMGFGAPHAFWYWGRRLSEVARVVEGREEEWLRERFERDMIVVRRSLYIRAPGP